MKFPVYNQIGQIVKEMELPDEVFGLKLNHDLMHQAYIAQKANSREAIANTKTRKEVRGGGKKPWKQKGTGRARHSSIRSPLWRGGGITFGPTSERNFSLKINKRMKTQAILMAISSKVVSGELVVLDNLELKAAKTKEANNIVKLMPVKGKLLIAQENRNEIIQKSFRNIPRVRTMLANSLNVVDLLETKNLIITEKGVEAIRSIFVK